MILSFDRGFEFREMRRENETKRNETRGRGYLKKRIKKRLSSRRDSKFLRFPRTTKSEKEKKAALARAEKKYGALTPSRFRHQELLQSSRSPPRRVSTGRLSPQRKRRRAREKIRGQEGGTHRCWMRSVGEARRRRRPRRPTTSAATLQRRRWGPSPRRRGRRT